MNNYAQTPVSVEDPREQFRLAFARIAAVPMGETMIDRISDEEWLGNEIEDANICAGSDIFADDELDSSDIEAPLVVNC